MEFGEEEDSKRDGQTISQSGRWTGLGISDDLDMTQDREQWKKFVVSLNG